MNETIVETLVKARRELLKGGFQPDEAMDLLRDVLGPALRDGQLSSQEVVRR